MSFWGNVVGISASLLLGLGVIAIGIGIVVLATQVHWAFAIAAPLLPIWAASMIAVMEWAIDL